MTVFGYELAHPWALLFALLAVPALWLSSLSAGRVVFSSLRALPAGGRSWRTAIAWLPDALVSLAVVALAIAIAGPRKGDESARVRRDGIAIMMTVDVSGSMRALDLADRNPDLTRLDAVKQLFGRFVLGGQKLDGRKDDAIGLVAFASYAETRSPLTLDHQNLALAAKELDFAAEGEDGTSIGAGLDLAVARLAEFEAKSKIVILLTDGESTVHEVDEDTAIDHAVKAGIKVYTIGAGTNAGSAPVRVPIGNGQTMLRQVRVSIDEATLRKIADKTGGQYFRATDHESLARIYTEIDHLERTTFEQEQFLQFHQYYDRYVLAALILVVAAALLRGTLLRRLP
ncbi:MAG: VWA domain-containing protein [Deltaproteobacteria bacterium]|nr:VWA domain-containing protein [Deltaproteobacteria bacterium]MCW5801216.1 VWA domain-containing protein [Deltaproteobacteria bacterium]